MHVPQNPRSRVVFVGNLPFDVTEEQLIEIFRSVGPVVNFRIVFDHQTGKAKGFGFAEYKDVDTAASAIRNLQGYEIGGRSLRLDFSDSEGGDKKAAGTSTQKPAVAPQGASGAAYGAPDMSAKQLPVGVPLPPSASATDSISQTLATMPPGQLLDIMAHMKQLVTTSPAEARALLANNPQLSYALFQAMLMMNVVDPLVLHKMLPSQGAAPPATYGGLMPPHQQLTPQQQAQGGFTPQYGGYQQQQPGGRSTPLYGQSGQQPIPGNATPTYGGPGGYQQGRQPQPPPQQQQQTPDQAALIAQVLSLTQAQIDALPEESRQTVMQIRAQAAGVMRR